MMYMCIGGGGGGNNNNKRECDVYVDDSEDKMSCDREGKGRVLLEG